MGSSLRPSDPPSVDELWDEIARERKLRSAAETRAADLARERDEYKSMWEQNAAAAASAVAGRLELEEQNADLARKLEAAKQALEYCNVICAHALEHYKGPVAMKIKRETAVHVLATLAQLKE